MPNITYNLGIPNTPNDPSVDQPKMKINNDANDTIWDVDHYGFNDNNGGKHNVIRFPAFQTLTPATGAFEWAEYTRLLASGAVETFWKRPNTIAGATDIQMTTNIAVSPVGINGQTFLPGGIIVKWGNFIGFNAASQNPAIVKTVNFVPVFPTNCFAVFTQVFWIGATAPSSEGVVNTKAPASVGSFTWQFNTNSSQFTGGGFYWLAIGN